MDILIPLDQYFRNCLWSELQQKMFWEIFKSINLQIIANTYIKQDWVPLTAKLYDKPKRIQIFCPWMIWVSMRFPKCPLDVVMRLLKFCLEISIRLLKHYQWLFQHCYKMAPRLLQDYHDISLANAKSQKIVDVRKPRWK